MIELVPCVLVPFFIILHKSLIEWLKADAMYEDNNYVIACGLRQYIYRSGQVIVFPLGNR